MCIREFPNTCGTYTEITFSLSNLYQQKFLSSNGNSQSLLEAWYILIFKIYLLLRFL